MNNKSIFKLCALFSLVAFTPASYCPSASQTSEETVQAQEIVQATTENTARMNREDMEELKRYISRDMTGFYVLMFAVGFVVGVLVQHNNESYYYNSTKVDPNNQCASSDFLYRRFQ